MTRTPPPSPKDRQPPARADRLKSALKANMAKRKAQARARAGGPEKPASDGKPE